MAQQNHENDDLLVEANRLIAEGDDRRDSLDFDTAGILYGKAISLRLTVLGELDESVAVAVNRLANVYFQQKKDYAAGELFERSLAIREVVLTADSPELRLSVNNLANAYRNQGRFSEAERLYFRSLQMKTLETGHGDHATIWRNLARVLKEQGKDLQAADYVEKIRRFESAENDVVQP